MMYLWLIPLVLVLVVAIMAFFNRGTKRPVEGESRMDQARAEDNRRDLRT
jgi:hypothetical protein